VEVAADQKNGERRWVKNVQWKVCFIEMRGILTGFEQEMEGQ
jgi:hypothetical protein